MNYKKKFYWAIGLVFILLVITLVLGFAHFIRSRNNKRYGNYNTIDKSNAYNYRGENQVQLIYTRPVIPEKTNQAEWDYRPSKNPTYENNTRVQQIGYVTMEKTTPEQEPKVMPLFGQSLRHKHSDRWNYFTATDQYQSIRIPVHFENRDCMNEDTGCREIYTNDTVTIPTYNDKNFTVNLYKNQLPHV